MKPLMAARVFGTIVMFGDSDLTQIIHTKSVLYLTTNKQLPIPTASMATTVFCFAMTRGDS